MCIRDRIELVHSHGMGPMGIAAMRIARKRKLPYIGSFHTLIQYATHYISGRKEIQDIAEKIAWKYLRWYYNKCDATVAPSQTIRSLLEENGFKNVNVIPNGIDTSRFSGDPEFERKDFGIGESDAVFLYVGRLVAEKNLDIAIRSAKRLTREITNAKFIIAGSGPAEQRYRELAEKEGVSEKFRFLGFVPEKKIPSLYKCSDVFIFPSKFETQGLTGIEAMASGLPVCGADYLAIKEIVSEGENGTLFNPDDPNEFTEKAAKAYEQRDSMRAAALQTAEGYSISKTTATLRKMYSKLLER